MGRNGSKLKDSIYDTDFRPHLEEKGLRNQRPLSRLPEMTRGFDVVTVLPLNTLHLFHASASWSTGVLRDLCCCLCGLCSQYLALWHSEGETAIGFWDVLTL